MTPPYGDHPGRHRASRPARSHLDRPTRLTPFPGAEPPDRPDVADDVDHATVYVPSTGELRRPGPAYLDDDALDRVGVDEPQITYDGVAPLVVFVLLVILLVVGLLVVVPWVLT